MRYGIVANPAADNGRLKSNFSSLRRIRDEVFPGARIEGLDTPCKEDFMGCASELEKSVDILIVAGGDGTFSDVINAVPESAALGYLPMGTGNGVGFAFGLPKDPMGAARRIKSGRVHPTDAVGVLTPDGAVKALLTTLGIEGVVTDAYNKGSRVGFLGYAASLLPALTSYGGYDAEILTGSESLRIVGVRSLIVSKSPFYGYGVNINPTAVMDDGLLHLRAMNPTRIGAVRDLLGTLFFGNKSGVVRKATDITIRTSIPQILQVEGDNRFIAQDFSYHAIPGCLKMVY